MLLVCYVLLYVVAFCVKMRYVILCIKRLLIDWLGLGLQTLYPPKYLWNG